MPAQRDESNKWFIEVDGKRHGPFGIKELQGLVEKGAIKTSTLVFSSGEQQSSEHSVGSLLKALSQPQYEEYSSDDPVTDLFNTLQVAREKTHTKPLPSHHTHPAPIEPIPPTKNLKPWVIPSLGVLLILGGTLMLLTKKKPLENTNLTPPEPIKALEVKSAPTKSLLRPKPQNTVTIPIPPQPTPKPTAQPTPTPNPVPPSDETRLRYEEEREMREAREREDLRIQEVHPDSLETPPPTPPSEPLPY